MKKIFRNLFLTVAALAALSSCDKKARNTEELIDPWLRERTPVNVRLEAQVGPAVITSDWRTDEVGSVSVSLVTTGLDMSAVKVVALDFQYPESEFCPTASIKPGDTIDLSDGDAEFVVTSKSGEIRTYTISYSVFSDPLEGTYSFTPVGPLMADAIGKHEYNCACVMIGGFEKYITLCQVMDKHWLWGMGNYDGIHWPLNEDDNILSFRLDKVDDITGYTFGTVVNTPGADGKYADYILKDSNGKDSNGDAVVSYDINDEYRLIPRGKARWAKYGDGYITIFDFEDKDYKAPLHKLELLESGEYKFWSEALDSNGESAEKTVNVPSLALHRSFGEGPFANGTNNWGEERWYVNNIRNVFWLIKKDTDSALEDHDKYLAE